MTKTYQIKINQGKPLDIPQAGLKGQAVTVKAVPGARYQLIDPEIGYGPENIRASRQGKDLKVSFEGSTTTDLVIEDYYKVSADNFNGLIGETESGKFYEYIPENAAGMATVPMLADAGQVVGMALGGAEVAPTGAAVGVLAAGLFNPWLLGAGALGLAAAGGSGSSAAKDTTAPNGNKAVGLKVDLDGNSDGTINGSEMGVASTTSLTATFDSTKVAVGDKVTFSDGNKTDVIVLTATDVAAGKVVSTAGWALPAEDASKTFAAVISNSLGSTTPKAEQTIKLDAVSESLKTALTIDPITGDNIFAISEQTATTVTVTGKVSGSFAAEDLVTLTINGKPFTASVDGKGLYTLELSSSDLKVDADTMIEGRVTGSIGGQLATAAQSYVVETQNTAGKTTGLLIDAITSDNILNIAESTPASVNINGKVTGKFAAGDMVNLLINGHVSSGAVKSDGSYLIAVDKNYLLSDGDTTVDATVTGTGGTSATALQNYGFDILVPDKLALTIDLDNGIGGLKYKDDGYINSTEKGSATTTGLTASFQSSSVSIGDVVTFSFNDGSSPQKVILDKDMVAAGKVTVSGAGKEWTVPEIGVLNVKVVISDAAGNSSTATDSATVDTSAMVFNTAVLAGVGQTVFTKATFGHGVLEKGTYKMHVGTTSFGGNLDVNLGFTETLSSPVSGVLGSAIYLEAWDVAGNYTKAVLPDQQLVNTWNLAVGTEFIV